MKRNFAYIFSVLCLLLLMQAAPVYAASPYFFFCPPNNQLTRCNECECTCSQMVRPCKAGQTWVKTVFGYICTGNPIAECMTSEVDNPPGSNQPGEYTKRGTKRDAWMGGPWSGDRNPDYIPGPYNRESIPQYQGGQGQCITKNKDGDEVKYKKCKPPKCVASVSGGTADLLKTMGLENDPTIIGIIESGQDVEQKIKDYIEGLGGSNNSAGGTTNSGGGTTNSGGTGTTNSGGGTTNSGGTGTTNSGGTLPTSAGGRPTSAGGLPTSAGGRPSSAGGSRGSLDSKGLTTAARMGELTPAAGEGDTSGGGGTTTSGGDTSGGTTSGGAGGGGGSKCLKWKCDESEPECKLTGGDPPQCKPECYECDTSCKGICDNAKFNCQQVDRDLYNACLAHAIREFNRCVYYWPQKHCETYMPDEEECCIRNRQLRATCNLP